jgi:hypothetical protein
MNNHPGKDITDYALGPMSRVTHIKAFTPRNIMRSFQQAGISHLIPMSSQMTTSLEHVRCLYQILLFQVPWTDMGLQMVKVRHLLLKLL